MAATAFQVAVVGGSLAGSALAIKLGRAGVTVALFEKSSFPRHKPCGEGLSRYGQNALEKMIRGELVSASCVSPISGYQMISLSEVPEKSQRLPIANEHQRGIGISRTEIDNQLFQIAKDLETVTCFSSEAVKSIHFDSPNWDVTSIQRSVTANLLVLANGASVGQLAQEYTHICCSASKRTGYSLHAQLQTGALAPYVSVLPMENGEIYLTPLVGREFNISIVGTASFVQKYHRPEILLPFLRDQLKLEIEICWRGAGAACFGQRIQSNHQKLFLTGDAQESFDPACGLGMTHAVTSATMASEEIIRHLAGQQSLKQATRRYVVKQQRLGLRIRLISRLIIFYFAIFRKFPRACCGFSGKPIAWLLEKTESLLLKPSLTL